MEKMDENVEKYINSYFDFSNKLIEEANKRLSNHSPQLLDCVDRAIASAQVASQLLKKGS